MPSFSPRLDPRLRAAALSLDDERRPIAETWRRVGALAHDLGLPRPGYDTVRLLVHARRRGRAEVRELLAPVAADVLQGRFSAWDVDRLARANTVSRRGR